MVQLTDNIYAIEVPDDVEVSKITDWTLYYNSENRNYFISLPPRSWQFLFTTKEATEEQRAFVAGLPFTDIVHGYTRDLFNNFLRSKGLNPNNNYAVIQNNING